MTEATRAVLSPGNRAKPCKFRYVKSLRNFMWNLCYRKDDRAMRPTRGCAENFRDSLTTPTATIPKIFHGLLFQSTLWMFVQNLNSVAQGRVLVEGFNWLKLKVNEGTERAVLSPVNRSKPCKCRYVKSVKWRTSCEGCAIAIRKDRAMRPIRECPENFRGSLTTPTATIPRICHELLFRSTIWMFLQNLKSVALPVPEIRGGC